MINISIPICTPGGCLHKYETCDDKMNKVFRDDIKL